MSAGGPTKVLGAAPPRCDNASGEVTRMRRKKPALTGLFVLGLMATPAAAAGGGDTCDSCMPIGDGDFVGTEVFTDTEIIIGRDPNQADLPLESTQVSRQHAVIEVDGVMLPYHALIVRVAGECHL